MHALYINYRENCARYQLGEAMLILIKDSTCTNSIKAVYVKGVFLALRGLILTAALVVFYCSVLSRLIYSKWWI